MARKPLRSQLNQIRAWAREGRTDAWIAHQLDVSASELREFRRRHDLSADGGEEAEADLRDEIEAEIEAATLEEPADDAEELGEEGGEEEQRPPEQRGRRRRRRRRRRRKPTSLQGTFDHGEDDGFGLWLDPAIQDEPLYAEHWAGHRAVQIEVEADRIVIKRSE